ncbi:MAG: sulfatase [Acidobacteriota bacterium]
MVAHAGTRLLLALFGCLLVACAAPGPSESTKPTVAEAPHDSNRPNVVIFMVDTLRADAVTWGGTTRPTTPKLESWAKHGAIFDQATTPAGWTRSAVASLFTGMYPAAHGVQDQAHVLPSSLLTLAEVFGANGYNTQAFVSNFAIAPQFGTDQGFQNFRFFDRRRDVSMRIDPKIGYVPIFFMDPEVKAYFQSPPVEPFFAYVHTTDPHQPYRPPVEYLLWGQQNRDRYDGEVRFSDDFIAGWIETLRSSGKLENTIVVFTADHGEEFKEHGGQGHGHTVFEEIVRIPLVIVGPGVKAARHSEQVSLLDLGPTLLQLAGLTAPTEFGTQGRSFASLLSGGGNPKEWNDAYHELIYPTKGIAFAYRDQSWKLVSIAQDSYGRKEQSLLFDLATDPTEQNDLSQREPGRLKSMKERLKQVRTRQLQAATPSQAVPLDPDAEDRLRTLGYVK